VGGTVAADNEWQLTPATLIPLVVVEIQKYDLVGYIPMRGGFQQDDGSYLSQRWFASAILRFSLDSECST